jgi:transcriptional regulator with XRE-family HTH domain
MELRTAIGQTLREIRTERGLVLRQIPHVATSHLAQIELGQKSASPEMLEHLARELDITTVELLQKICQTMERNPEWH